MKLMGFERGITILAGLPVRITTPAHGTAFDIAGRGTARDGALREAYAPPAVWRASGPDGSPRDSALARVPAPRRGQGLASEEVRRRPFPTPAPPVSSLVTGMSVLRSDRERDGAPSPPQMWL